jgi:hypothetical protein
MKREKCIGCGKYVSRRKLVWTADSEGLCFRCCEIKHIKPFRSPEDGLFYPIYEYSFSDDSRDDFDLDEV